MKKRRRTQILILASLFIFLMGFGGCGGAGTAENKTADSKIKQAVIETKTTAEAVSSEGISKSDVTLKEDKKEAASQGAADLKKDGVEELSSTASESDGKQEEQPAEKYSIKLSGSGLKGEVVFSEQDIKNMAAESGTYSFRNKEKNNIRQFTTFSGVPITTLLKAAGWDGTSDILRITCSDGYSNRYKISEINDLYSYPDSSGTQGTKVPAMIAILEEGSYMGNDLYYHHSEGSPFRLIYGQEDFDSDFTKDFNMQGWGYYISELVVENK